MQMKTAMMLDVMFVMAMPKFSGVAHGRENKCHKDNCYSQSYEVAQKQIPFRWLRGIEDTLKFQRGLDR